MAAVALLAAPSATASSRVVQQLAQLQRAGVVVPRVVKPVERRALTLDEPALADTYQPGIAWEWQWADSRVGDVPDWVLRAAAGVKIAVIDSGADVNAPDLADKSPRTWSVLSRSHPRARPARARHVRRLAGGGLGLERQRRLRLRRRRAAAGRPGDRRRRLHHRRGRGDGDRLRRQAWREDRQPLDRRLRDLGRRAARDPLGRPAWRPDRRGRRERARRGQPARVPGRAAAAPRLARPRRDRPRGGRDLDGRLALLLLEHRLLPLAGGTGLQRLRGRVGGRTVAARAAAVELAGLLRLGQRHVVLLA